MLKLRNICLFLIVGLISLQFCPSQCLLDFNNSDYESESCGAEDPYFMEDRQELADEIQDVNDYMKIVADQLNNDGVIVVRAITTKFITPDVESISKSGAGDSDGCCDESEYTPSPESVGSLKTDIESPCEYQNFVSLNSKHNETKQNDFEMNESSSKIENSGSGSVEAEVAA